MFAAVHPQERDIERAAVREALRVLLHVTMRLSLVFGA
jgi:hypothetical protein